ncbi:uncharacterized protein BDZ83DRAFT_732358 [Colletotrichum acutatum]|uniref:Uncharacterized protein n=1 Tax=Glomerella acutata TaxID=27357 RepID=A0AAD8UKA7_GLOAC|nr:uncharacterized protein BDZ83DRAFT_732358 [Colletotrichum acutatum]KAK1722784.1 hypothetical protein BDZ83DRAFT_732358 [Colletotrichum acutatum]
MSSYLLNSIQELNNWHSSQSWFMSEAQLFQLNTQLSTSYYITMTSPHTNQEALKIILTKLNRLELRFNEIDGRLGAIECSVVSDTSTNLPSSPTTRQSVSSCTCTLSDIPQPLFQENCKLRQCSASTYRASVDRLRRRFEFDACSEVAPRISEEEVVSPEFDLEEIIDGYSDAQSVSFYPSRSISRFSFAPRESRPSRDIPEIPSLRYEDLMIHAEQTSYTESSRRSRRSSATETFSEANDSPSTAATSFIQGSWAGSRRSSTAGICSKRRGSIRRAAPGLANFDTVGDIVEKLVSSQRQEAILLYLWVTQPFSMFHPQKTRLLLHVPAS